MKHLLRLTAGILFLTGNFLVQAQFHAPGGLPPGFHHALLDVLAGGPAFYGKAKIQLTNGPDKEPTTIFCDIAVLSGNMRLEFDSLVPGANLPPTTATPTVITSVTTAVTNLKDMHSITILRPDKNRMYMVFPDFKSYVELAYARGAETNAVHPPQITKKPLGKELVGDQPCAKSQWNVVEGNGEHYDITVWLATKSGNFPIQIKVGSPSALVEFQDLHLEEPNSSLFELPAGYTKYEGIQENIQHEVEKAKNANSP